MFGSLRRAWALRRAARSYAMRLGPRLAHEYGGGTHYTAAQIEAAAQRAKLPAAHLALGYAGFLTSPEFEARWRPGDPSRDVLLGLLDRYTPRHVSQAFGHAAENADASAGAPLGF